MKRVLQHKGIPAVQRHISPGTAGFMVSCLILLLCFLSASAGEPVYKGKLLREWVINIQGRDPDYHRPTKEALEAIEAVRAVGSNGIPYFLKWIQDTKDSRLPSAAVGAFRVLGTQATSAIPKLERILEKNNPPHSIKTGGKWDGACEALSYLGPDALPVMLKVATNVPDQHARSLVIGNLGNFGSNGIPAIPALIGWCHDEDSWVRLRAINALGQIGQQPRVVIPVLLAALQDSNGLVRRDAATALGSFGKTAEAAVPNLIKMLDDPDWQAQTGAIHGLGKIGAQRERVMPLLGKKLHDENRIVRRCAAFALGDLGGKEAFDALMRATNDPDGFVREAVFRSLKQIDPQALAASGKKFY